MCFSFYDKKWSNRKKPPYYVKGNTCFPGEGQGGTDGALRLIRLSGQNQCPVAYFKVTSLKVETDLSIYKRVWWQKKRHLEIKSA